jgi:hypothetical protein
MVRRGSRKVNDAFVAGGKVAIALTPSAVDYGVSSLAYPRHSAREKADRTFTDVSCASTRQNSNMSRVMRTC